MTTTKTIAFDDLLDRRHLKPVYQPIVDLSTGEQIAAEALARWPDLDMMPDPAFEWASHEGRLGELDEACRNAAIDDAIAHGLPRQFELFVNLEPSVLGPHTATRLLDRAAGQAGLVVEITERSLLQRPAELLRAVHQLRESGCAIALDDVGAVPDSLVLLPFVAPDVIKLDISLVQRWPNVEQASIYTTVAAYVERTGATVLAEGIESETHLEQALALGATVGQGWFFSHPGPLGEISAPGPRPRPSSAAEADTGQPLRARSSVCAAGGAERHVGGHVPTPRTPGTRPRDSPRRAGVLPGSAPLHLRHDRSLRTTGRTVPAGRRPRGGSVLDADDGCTRGTARP